MKKYFAIGLAIIILLSLGLISWGAYLNMQGEHNIASRMEGRKLALTGEQAAMRTLKPVMILDEARLTSKNMADAVALVDGRLVKSYKAVNDRVSEGTLLFQIVNDELPMKEKQADSDILKAEAEFTRAQNSYNRYQSLINYNATSLEKLDEARANFKAAAASVEAAKAARAQLDVLDSRQQVLAPLAGSVILTYKNVGSYVTAGTPIALIGDFSELYFTETLPAELAKMLNIGDELTLDVHETDTASVVGTGEVGTSIKGDSDNKLTSYKVVVTNIGDEVNDNIDCDVEFRLLNSKLHLNPQTYRHLHLAVKEPVTALTVPLVAMLNSRNDSVFVLTDAGVIEKREVQTGLDDGEYIEILSGLNEGDVVITSNTDGLESGMAADVALGAE